MVEKPDNQAPDNKSVDTDTQNTADTIHTEASMEECVVINSTRFGEFEVTKTSIIEIPFGLIGFPSFHDFIMIDHKPPFSWLQSTTEPGLAFVVIDGFNFGQEYDLSIPYSVKECDFKEDDEFAILLIVTVRSDPKQTTANLKAPVFVNIRNKKGVQVIYDNQKFSTRFPLWSGEEGEENASKKE
jgi:flagellar assembly factor FliW